MNIPVEILLLTSGIGALQSAFFGMYLFTLKRSRHLTTLLLAFLLLAFAVRMMKSVSYYFAEGHEIPELLQNFGYGANLAILPLLWLYLNAFLIKDYRLLWVRDSIHLLLPVLVILLSPFITPHFWMDQHGYRYSLILMGAYLPFCFYVVQKRFCTLNRPQQIWISGLTVGVTIVWAGYTANFIFHLVPYIAAPVIFTFVIYFMSYLALQQGNIFIRESKNSNGAYLPAELERCFEKLQHVMAAAQLFKDPSLTLPKAAKHIAVSAHLLSAAINTKSSLNFSDFINSYRIREAQALLSKREYSHQKIAAIAFEIGFNSLSAFNASFKKVTSMTPSEFRRQASGGFSS
jgi:AraC-like DNA-binding protein